ncbi:uncharacterized protein LOC106161722 [Lingula anatina]|uniref:Uncharacterized protein LOC106161722 n=1 Tax=Lingula anatina TaxID=7574 RepID=A0A1S3I7E4_LINAN|nr:uncharacterized protein LOC106161722 [Lingula anatina]|eukprot:XP_013394200.1 uncharacterized protein LOC106161722 [Lingula anatina]
MEKLQPCVFTADATEGEPFSLDIAGLEELLQECTTSKAGPTSLGHKSGKKKSRQPSAQKIKRETGQKTENAQTRLSFEVKSPAQTVSESQLDQDVSPGSLSHRTAWRDTLKTGRHPGSDGCASLPTSPENKSFTESKTYPGCESYKVKMKPEVSLETARLKNARSPFSESFVGPTSPNTPQQNKYGTAQHLVNVVSSEQAKDTSPIETLSHESVLHSVSTITYGMSSPRCINSLQDISNMKLVDVTGDKVTLDNRIVDTKPTVSSGFSTSPRRPNSGPFKTARNPLQFSN